MQSPPPILQKRLKTPPWTLPGGTRLPGISPAGPDNWLTTDDAFADQMALRDQLLRDRTEDVHQLRPEAWESARELLGLILDWVAAQSGYVVNASRASGKVISVVRPDGVEVAIDDDAPLISAARLVQEDLCIHLPYSENSTSLTEGAQEHALYGAVLCFPASWTLAEKIGHPLTRIHEPVNTYDSNLARRVQRLFDAVRVGQPLVRANCLTYVNPDLHQPRLEADPRDQTDAKAEFVRSERQCLLRLPQTDAVVFTIHTTIVARASLTAEEEQALTLFLAAHDT